MKTTEEVNVPLLDDEFCSDTTYRNEPNKEMKSVETQTIEAGIRPSTSKAGFDYYTLQYDDLTDSQ
jgi:hypothetical protein